MLYKSILIIKRGALGDMLAGTAAILAIRKQYPWAHLCLLSDGFAFDICPAGTIVDEIIDERIFLKNKLGYFKLLGLLRRRKFDLIINLRWVSEVSGLLTLLGGSEYTAGAGTWWLRKLFTFSPSLSREEANEHEYLLNLRIVQAIEVQTKKPQLFINISNEDKKWADDFFSIKNINPSEVLIITPIASTPLKAWPAERFVQIGNQFIKEFNAKVLITYSPSDMEQARAVHTSILGSLLAPKTTINQLAALVAKVSLCLCNNSGIMHVAYSVETPVVCINTSIGWAPYGDWNVAVTQLPDQPSQIDNRRLTNEQTFELLKQISVERVWNALSAKWKSLDQIKQNIKW